jgi:hypothetical protein
MSLLLLLLLLLLLPPGALLCVCSVCVRVQRLETQGSNLPNSRTYLALTRAMLVAGRCELVQQVRTLLLGVPAAAAGNILYYTLLKVGIVLDCKVCLYHTSTLFKHETQCMYAEVDCTLKPWYNSQAP